MQALRTIIPARRSTQEINHQHQLLMMGSCFTENIGAQLAIRKFNIDINPFGIVYNPVSIAKGLDRLLNKQLFIAEDLIENNGLWHSFEHHGDFSGPHKSVVLDNLNERLLHSASRLDKTDWVLLTLGTAQVHIWRQSGQVVANNHKFPAQDFEEQTLTLSSIEQVLGDAIQRLQAIKPGCKIMLTVSPVRHLRKGAVEHQRSKARLLLACETMSQQFQDCYYFPAYELLMDDLRDYRFYNDDLIHPTSLAIEYVFEHFCETYLSESSSKLADQVCRINQAVQHRPFRADTAAHQQFVHQQLTNIENMKKQHPYLDFTAEINSFTAQLNTSNI